MNPIIVAVITKLLNWWMCFNLVIFLTPKIDKNIFLCLNIGNRDTESDGLWN